MKILKKTHKDSIITRLQIRSNLAKQMFDVKEPHIITCNNNLGHFQKARTIIVLQVLPLDGDELLVEFVYVNNLEVERPPKFK